MNLIIDIGNSFIKLAVFQGDVLQVKKVVNKPNFQAGLVEIFASYPQISQAILSSVSVNKVPWPVGVDISLGLLVLGPETKLPYANKYSTPLSLGNDRRALVAAAAKHYPKQDVLVIDAGTCITYDFKNKNNEYLGGGISPGLQMRYDAMHHFTARLPSLSPVTEVPFIGTSTQESMHSGVILGLAHEVDGIIGDYQKYSNSLEIILTGGDAHFLSLQLKNTIFASSNFLVEGLNHILEFNNIP